jgi:DNA-binding NarL/FixJ family response regulator
MSLGGKKMNILINLKSRLIGDALSEMLNKECCNGYIISTNTRTGVQHCKPDVIIVDRNCIGSELNSLWPEAKLILLDTGLRQEELITLILQHNLQGVISTDEDIALTLKALKLVGEGQIWLDNNNLKALLTKAGKMSRTGKIDGISKREKDVLELITQGKKNKEIAALLYMSEQTVKVHVSHIFKKYNVSSRSQLLSQMMLAPPEKA